MQILTASPRDGLTIDQVTALLQAAHLEVDHGCELLDLNDNVVQDISSDLIGGTVKRQCLSDVHGAVDLELNRQLAWGRDRVRPYLTLSADLPVLGYVTARFNLGVYVMTTPDQPVEADPVFKVQGYDKLHVLQAEVGDSYSVPVGTGYLGAVRAAISAAGAGTKVLLDSAAADKVLTTAMVWPLTNSDQTSWLRIVNDLLAAIGYRGVWADQDGYLRSEPYRPAGERSLEWRFDVDDERTTIVGEDRTVTTDTWGVPNWWRFLRRDLLGTPFEGGGQYTVINQSGGLTSVDSIGRRVPKVVWLDAADQASLTAQGDAIVAADQRVSAVLKMKTGPLPIAGHFDVVAYTDTLRPDIARLQAREWSMPLDGSDMDWTWEVVS